MKKIELLWAIPTLIITYLLVEAIWLVMFIIGLVLIIPAIKWAPKEDAIEPEWAVVVPEYWPNGMPMTRWKWRWLDEIIGNHEEGILPSWWKDHGGTILSWYIRNPVTNMRFWPIVSTKATPDVRWCGTSDGTKDGWFVIHHKWFVGWWWRQPTWKIWVGFKLMPFDAIPSDRRKDYRWYGCGVGCQFIR